MEMIVPGKFSASIVYFESEGKQNLRDVLRVLRGTFKKRNMRSVKVVILTGRGEGPVLAYNMLQEYDPRIIAVTFPPTFAIKTEEGEWVNPQIPAKVKAFFKGVDVPILTGRLPFDKIEGAEAHNNQMKVIRDTLSLLGGSIPLLVQAVLQACDMGAVNEGERVIGMTGDSAAIVTASSTLNFLRREGGLEINEILCKPREFTLIRKKLQHAPEELSGNLFEDQKKTIELPRREQKGLEKGREEEPT